MFLKKHMVFRLFFKLTQLLLTHIFIKVRFLPVLKEQISICN